MKVAATRSGEADIPFDHVESVNALSQSSDIEDSKKEKEKSIFRSKYRTHVSERVDEHQAGIVSLYVAPWAIGSAAQSIIDTPYDPLVAPIDGIDPISGIGFAPLRVLDFALATRNFARNTHGLFSARSGLREAERSGNAFDIWTANLRSRQAASALTGGGIGQVRDMVTDPINLVRTLAFPALHVASSVGAAVSGATTGFSGVLYVADAGWKFSRANRSIRRSTNALDRLASFDTEKPNTSRKKIGKNLTDPLSSRLAENPADAEMLADALSFKGEKSLQWKTKPEERALLRSDIAAHYLKYGLDSAVSLSEEFKNGTRRPGELSSVELDPANCSATDVVRKQAAESQAKNISNARHTKRWAIVSGTFGVAMTGLSIGLIFAFPPAGIAVGACAGAFLIFGATGRLGRQWIRSRKKKKAKKEEAVIADRLLADGADYEKMPGSQRSAILLEAMNNRTLSARIMASDILKGDPAATGFLESCGLSPDAIADVRKKTPADIEKELTHLLFSANGEKLRRSTSSHRGLVGIAQDSIERKLKFGGVAKKFGVEKNGNVSLEPQIPRGEAPGPLGRRVASEYPTVSKALFPSPEQHRLPVSSRKIDTEIQITR